MALGSGLYDSIISDADRHEVASIRAEVEEITAGGATQLDLEAALQTLLRHVDSLEQEAADLDVLYSTTVEHATTIENELMARNEQVSEFLANMSHELRTPLNAVIGYSDLIAEIAEEDGYSAIADDLDKIRSAGTHLLGLISNVLDLSKIEAGKMELAREDIEVAMLFREVSATIEPLALRGKNQFVVEVGAELGTVSTDATRLRQCLINLLGNSCKFTRNGVVTLTARACEGCVEFEVVDTGIGMNPEELSRIFMPFQQATSTTAQHYGGTGLGLTLTLSLVQAMGGKLVVESTPGQGTTFRFRLRSNPPSL